MGLLHTHSLKSTVVFAHHKKGLHTFAVCQVCVLVWNFTHALCRVVNEILVMTTTIRVAKIIIAIIVMMMMIRKSWYTHLMTCTREPVRVPYARAPVLRIAVTHESGGSANSLRSCPRC